MADISKITLPSNAEYNIKDATARSELSGKQDVITADGILQGDGEGNITAADTTATGILSNPSSNGTYVLQNTISNNSSTLSWGTVDALPSQTNNSGKYLTTNGTTASWAAVDTLPSQSGNSGKFLTTNGSTASWGSTSTATALGVETAPSNGSSNLVTSGGVYTAISNKANIASPTFTGTPAAPTATAGTNTTQIATTAFVGTALDNKITYGTTDLTAGTSTLATGTFYFVYE